MTVVPDGILIACRHLWHNRPKVPNKLLPTIYYFKSIPLKHKKRQNKNCLLTVSQIRLTMSRMLWRSFAKFTEKLGSHIKLWQNAENSEAAKKCVERITNDYISVILLFTTYVHGWHTKNWSFDTFFWVANAWDISLY